MSASLPPLHPIAVVAQRTGLSPDLLRMWERRYGAVTPARTPAGERLYSDADVERLRLLAAAVDAGRRIGQVARIPSTELAALVQTDRSAAARRPSPDLPSPDPRRAVIDAALAHIAALDARALDDLLRRSAAVEGTVGFVSGIAAPLLRRVGDEWHAGRLSIAEEHFASTLIEGVVVELMRAIRPSEEAPTVLVATPAGSRHVIAAAMVAVVAAAEGWNVFFLGGDLPGAEIATAARAVGVQAVALSVLYADRLEQVHAELGAVQAGLPDDTPLIVGGQAIVPVAAALARSGAHVGETLDDLRTVLREIAARR